MDILGFLQQHNVRVVGSEHEHGRHGWVQIDCPWCKTEEQYHLGINLQHAYANCWHCGHHRLWRVLSAVTNAPGAELGALLKGLELKVTTKEHIKGKLILPRGVAPVATAHRRYIVERGLNPVLVEQLWSIQGLGHVAGNLKWRLFIPIYYLGEMVSWTTRAIGNQKKRYISAKPTEESMPNNRLLYGADYCRGACVVHEGPIDVWHTGPGAVALLGMKYTQAQVNAISKYPVRVICFDSEPDAQRRAGQLCLDLAPFPGTTHNVMLESGKDAAEANAAEVAELREAFL